MTSPEAIYARLTSGNVGTTDTLELDLSRGMKVLTGAIGAIELARDVPNWDSPSARTRYNMNAWATKAMAETSFIRTNRAKLAVGKAGADYRTMVKNATEIIERWRKGKRTLTSGYQIMVLRSYTIRQLTAQESWFGRELDEARDFIETEDLNEDQKYLLENGLVRSMRFDLSDPTDMGPIIPNTLATGDDDLGLSPQGLGVDPETGNLLQTSYNDDGEAVLSIIDPDTGELVNSVNLGRAGDGGAPDHAGGVSVHDGKLFVSSSSPAQIYTYDMADIQSASLGETVEVRGTPQDMKAGAYSTVYNGMLYVGSFTEDENTPGELYTYTWDKKSQSWTFSEGPFDTPPQTQGVSIANGFIFFSSSYGRGFDSRLTAFEMSTGKLLGTEHLPNMSEGTVALPNGLLTTFESGSSKYDIWNAVTPKEDMWMARNMTVTPYSEFGLSNGLEVEPPTLREASKKFRVAQDTLEIMQRQFDTLTLPASALGGVAEATTFANAVVSHLDTTSTWLDEGRITADVTASGLVSSAEEYERTDDGAKGALNNLQRFLARVG